MQSVLRANKHVAGRIRTYSSIAISANDEIAYSNDTIKSNTTSTSTSKVDQKQASQIQHLLQSIPSSRLAQSYKTTALYITASQAVEVEKNDQIRRELIKLREQRDYISLVKIMEIWSASNIGNMVEVLGRETITEYMSEMIELGHLSVVKHYDVCPILKSLAIQNDTGSYLKNHKFTPMEMITKLRKIYNNLLYDSKSGDFMYDFERRKDIYNSKAATGHKLNVGDFENLMQMELGHYKLDLASRWFKLFRQYFGGDKGFGKYMTPKMWTMALQTEAHGQNSHWEAKGSNLATYKINPLAGRVKSRRFKRFENVKFTDFQQDSIWPDLTLHFHSALIQHFGYKGDLDQMKRYIEFIWGVDASGKLVGKKLDVNDRLYPDLNFLKNLFYALAYHGEFFAAIKYVNDFKAVYESIKERNRKTFWEKVFKSAHHSTTYSMDAAFQYFLKESKYSGKCSTLAEAQNDPNFDYEGYLQFIDKLKKERRDVIGHVWAIVLNDDEIVFSNYIYKRYLSYLKGGYEDEAEQSYYNYMTSLLKQYQRHHTGPNSFTRKAGQGFEPAPNYDDNIRVLYGEAIRSLISYKGKNKLLGQLEPLIEEWAFDEEMKEELAEWVGKRMPYFRKDLETKRLHYMLKLREEDNEKSEQFLSLL
ncbi:hypothetical protein Cantr_06134 [Candida viswanathii]|uniref:ATPase expression protein 2, mitochondrial n=1 Tax=Candida viswanathii TaxID=5486 RepID=A0A367XUR1_9ASCO|nr:hypothetical protein Cantr_06134 [Candida viswanathii]